MKIRDIKKIAVGFCVLCIFLLPAMGLAAEKFPSRAITIICAYSPGGSWDTISRLIAEDMKAEFGVPTEVKNKPGASGTVALMELLKSKPDGYTMCTVGTGVMTESLVRKVPYDLYRDVIPVANFSGTEYGLAVKSESPFKTYRDLVEYARKNPGAVKYAASGLRVPQNLQMVTIAEFEKIKWTVVPIKGTSEGIAALLGGHVTAYSGSMAMYPQIKAGKIRPLAIYSAKRLDLLPDVACVTELGIARDYVMPRGWGGMFVVKGVPPEKIKVLDLAIEKTLKKPHVIEKMKGLLAPPVYLSAKDLLKAIDEFTTYTKRALALIEQK